MLTAAGLLVPAPMPPELGDLLVQAVVNMLTAVLGQQKAELHWPSGTTLRTTTVVAAAAVHAVLPGTGIKTGAGTTVGGRRLTSLEWAKRIVLILGLLQEQQARRGMAGLCGAATAPMHNLVQGAVTCRDHALEGRQTMASVVARRVLAARRRYMGSLR